jgi:hypothetical protein
MQCYIRSYFIVILFLVIFSSHRHTIRISDDMIKARAKSNVVDRTEGTRVARRNATRNARRGISTSSKPTTQQIAQEIQKQSHQSTVKLLTDNVQRKNKRSVAAPAQMDVVQASTRPNKTSLKKKLATRQLQHAVKAADQHHVSAATTTDNIERPTRPMIQAAKTAMIAAGYIFPPRTTLHVVAMPAKSNGRAGGTNPPNTTVMVPQHQQQQPLGNNVRTVSAPSSRGRRRTNARGM